MRKKLNLVLREPVKLHETSVKIPELPSRFEQEKEAAKVEKTTKPPKNDAKKLTPTIEKPKTPATTKTSVPKPNISEGNLDKILETMPPRVRQIWDYFCEAAKQDGDLQNSFVVTRSEVMRHAGIGSTNTYRDALRKFQTAGLLEIELRPGVNSGSIFHLTEKGIELVKD